MPDKEEKSTDEMSQAMGKKKQQYKSVRIYPEDFQEYRRLAFHNDTSIVETISQALAAYKEKFEDGNR
ncbi:hypothetical protein QRD89_11180 [Halobacillus sp. ACCC02827]|uniref:hypothetical protein n=1 Tax=Bacillaceae TaxID=186817 RepID=UPI0002A502B1|nr:MULTISPECIES: hypothetical protein [Bacillaceae]ELK44907.1 hypothetical protein D479_17099 [Halobacillus sp. BAB-2008]QHT47062.1 hypothetical protein M662_11350 [Bacillus sp. SB49]WJE14288.1 hypothetical protein QRD89_11180 [Halobacillus sp. ACCC02827]